MTTGADDGAERMETLRVKAARTVAVDRSASVSRRGTGARSATLSSSAGGGVALDSTEGGASLLGGGGGRALECINDAQPATRATLERIPGISALLAALIASR